MADSPLVLLARLPEDERNEILERLTDEQATELLRDWHFHARPEQLAPAGVWRWWVVVTGRGWGKNRTGSEWVVERCEQFAQHMHPHRVALMNRTFTLVRALQIEGESGIAAVCERKGYEFHHPATALWAELRIPTPSGVHTSHLEVHTADDPDRVRGRNVHTAHADELAAWRHKVDSEGGTAFTNMDLALRSLCPPGLEPQGLVTTTPRPTKIVKALLASEYGRTVITRGSLFDNAANLAPGFIEAVLRRYEGTRLGRQEIHGVVLDDVEGALWTYTNLEEYRIDVPPECQAPVVGVDPPGEVDGAECGIVVVATETDPADRSRRHGYVLEDASVAGQSAEGWATAAVQAYHRHQASALVVETNHGGDMVRAVIQAVDPSVRIVKVRASQGKRVRAEPISAMYEQGRIHHVGEWPELEEQMCTWVLGDPVSPDRMDALVWAFSHAMPPAPPGSATAPSGSGLGWKPATVRSRSAGGPMARPVRSR